MTPENDPPAPELEIYWHHVPTYFVDGPLGSAWMGGIHRIALGEFVLNTTAGAESPAARPVANLVMSVTAIRNFITYLQALPGVSEDAAGE